MLFSTFIFIFYFLPLVLLGVFLLPRTSWKNVFLIVASLVFYAWGEGTMIWLLLLSALMNYGFGRGIGGTSRSGTFLVTGIIVNLGVLFAFKYLSFFVSFLPKGFHLHSETLKFHLPIGISFFTFQGLSYLIDVYRNKTNAEKSLVKVMLYICLFPQLLAGPIIKFHEIRDQLTERSITAGGLVEGARRFIAGLAKKVLIANPLGILVADILQQDLSQLGSSAVWLFALSFTLQIYFDFSGYSDMAIGLGRMMGFRYPENFNFPYISRSVREFWRRWHISLSTWLRDYLFLPVAYRFSARMKKERYYGKRTDLWIYAFATLITMLLCGLWHGASWSFVLWGLYFGVFMTLEQWYFGRFLKKHAWVATIYTLLVVMAGWVLFRAESLTQARGLLKLMSGLGHPGRLHALYFLDPEYVTLILAGVLFSIPWYPALEKRQLTLKPWFAWTESFLMILVFLLSVMTLATDTYNPFIYFRF